MICLSKPPWQQQQKHGQTKDSTRTQVAQCIHFKILFISYPSSETQQHISPKFAWGKNKNSDCKLNPAHFSYGKDDVLHC